MNRIRELRERKGIKAEKLAGMLGITVRYLYDLETGKRRLNEDHIKRLCNILEVDADCLLGLTDDPSPYTQQNEEAKQAFRNAVKEDQELYNFWLDMEKREDLKILFKQAKKLGPEAIKDVVKYIRFVEMEEERES